MYSKNKYLFNNFYHAIKRDFKVQYVSHLEELDKLSDQF